MIAKLVALGGLCAALAGCGTPKYLPAAADFRGSDSQVAVVGKFELVPPFDAKLEQRTHLNVIGDDDLLNHIIMTTGPSFEPLNNDSFTGSAWQSSIKAEWGVPFKVLAPRRRNYLNGGVVHLDFLANERLWFPGGYYFDVPAGAAAIYIGTLRFTRNEFDRITQVEVIDERKDWGPNVGPGIQRSLLKKVR